jgi:hypothetical protein
MAREEMREGAFALIDCLGFRGIWKRHDPAILANKLKNISSEINAHTSGILPNEYLKEPLRTEVTLLSDSVAISMQYEDCKSRSAEYKNYLVWLLCCTTIKVLDLFLKDEPHLVLRGCVTYGEFDMVGNFIFGPAVDDAAEYAEVSQGAFVWLLPEAAQMYGQCEKSLTHKRDKTSFKRDESPLREWVKRTICKKGLSVAEVGEVVRDIESLLAVPTVIENYSVPLKEGQQVRCSVLNPFGYHTEGKDRRLLKQQYAMAMPGNQLGVVLKRQHTMDFLDAAERACVKHIERSDEGETPDRSDD